ncbi:MAG: N-6 DNA methylase [Nocardioides sp.]|nr:N-6 DNA methylase [Nocardioides sp.]
MTSSTPSSTTPSTATASRLTSVRVAGGLLPADVITAVLAGSLDGLKGSDYHLGSEAPREAAARAWTHLLGAYRRFRDELDRLPEGDATTGLTRERWISLVLADLGYGRVPPTPTGGLVAGEGAAAKSYPVSHLWGATPIHQLGWNVDLDRRTPGLAGAARAPHALVQELLNRTDDYLWAILTNGRSLRLLRDSTTLTGFAYVEFDLEAMFDGELYSEFALLYLLAHQSRVEVAEGEAPSTCWLERWRTTAIGQGVRALTLLRAGVESALETLGTGFLQHPANEDLRQRLADGTIRPTDVHAALLRLVYRLLFWAVAEDRDALHAPEATREQRQRYRDYFSSARLRDLALTRHGSAHDDLWESVRLVHDALGRSGGEPRLGLPGLGGLFSPTAADVLAGSRLPNTALLAAIRSLSVVQPKGEARRVVDFAHLGAEELGSVYESLLELVPRHDPVTHAFSYAILAGNDRKTTGSYYTPTELVELVLDTALDPVLDDVEKRTTTPQERAEALLDLKVCDPAVGSAHFLVAAARRIALRLATARTGELDPTPVDYSDALHDVVARCLYGVDLNPMSADLAKVSLWLTAMTPGKPLSFLDHHIKVGNALLGTTPALLAAGVPSAAFVALTGDDKATAAAWKKANTAELRNRGQGDLFGDDGLVLDTTPTRRALAEISGRLAGSETVDDVAWAAQRHAALDADPVNRRNHLVADAWCAAFLGPKTPDAVAITDRVVNQVAEGTADQGVLDAVHELATRHRLFHWHLEFPDVFSVSDDWSADGAYGWTGGFDSVLTNPPWEAMQFSEKEFFATRDGAISEAATASIRKRMIGDLEQTNPTLFEEYRAESRRGQAEGSLIKNSGRYPLTATGKLNTYSVFAEHSRASLALSGRSGIITPTGLATDVTTAAFFADTVAAGRLEAFLDFVTGPEIWSGIGHNRFRFAISCMTGGEIAPAAKLSFYKRHPRELELAGATYLLSADELLMLNPNTGTLPIFPTRRDADITLTCYRNHPVLIRDGGANPWGVSFKQGLVNMASDSGLFRNPDWLADQGATYAGWAWETDDRSWLPLYEAKMVTHWNNRLAGYANLPEGFLGTSIPRLPLDELDDPDADLLARYWVDENEVLEALPQWWDRDWLFGWRDIARADDARTFVPSALPVAAVGHVFPLAFATEPTRLPLVQAVWSSLCFDYVARQKLSGTHMTYGVVKQLPVPAPTTFEEQPAWSDVSLAPFVRPRVLELTYTSHRMAGYARDVLADGSEPGAPFRWLPDRRAQLLAELDAAMFHIYGLDRAAVEHVLDSFPVVRKNEERDLGEYRTRRLVLAAYDAMTEAAASGKPFSSPLDPPPGQGPRHPERSTHERRR